MRILKAFGIILLVLVVLFLVIAIFLPSKFHLRETIEINSPVSSVFEQVNKFSNWSKWSPFQENDPDMLTTYEGKESGLGAIMKWQSKEANGSLMWTEVVNDYSLKGEMIIENMDKSMIYFEFEKTPMGCYVSWAIDIDDLSYPLGRWKGVFMKSKLTDYFQKGLFNLKSICDNGILIIKSKWHTSEVFEKEVSPITALSIKDSCTIDNFSSKFEEIYSSINEYMKKMKVEQAGYPFCVYYNWNPNGVIVFEAGIPINKNVNGKGRIQLSELSGGKTLMVSQFGPYETTGDAHNAIDKYMKDKGLECVGAPWEVYITDPGAEPDTAKWETQIYYPIR